MHNAELADGLRPRNFQFCLQNYWKFFIYANFYGKK